MCAHLVQPMGVKCECTHEVTDFSDIMYVNVDYNVRCRKNPMNK